MFRTIRIALSARRVPSGRFRCGVNALRAEVTHFSPGVVAASEAVATGHSHKHIDVLQTEREKVKKPITSTSMVKAREIAIHIRVEGIGKKIAAPRERDCRADGSSARSPQQQTVGNARRNAVRANSVMPWGIKNLSQWRCSCGG